MMRSELRNLRDYLVELTQMEPERALKWLKDERLLDEFIGACDRADECLRLAYAPPAHEVEELMLKLPPVLTVRDRLGRSDAQTLASWIRDLPLKSGWTVGIVETPSTGEAEIVVHHVAAEKTNDYAKFVKASRAFESRAEGPGSRLWMQIHAR
jgi:hypothetical protein